MNFFTKIHELFRQKEQIVKKPQKHDANLQKNSTLYFQVGLIICLLATNALFEMYFETTISKPITLDPGINEVTYVATPKIYKEHIAMVKPKPKLDVRRPLTKPPIIKDNNFVMKPKKPVIDDGPPLKSPVVSSPPPKVPVKTTYHAKAVEQVPIFPGCEELYSNEELIKCMSGKLKKHVQRKFDTEIASERGLIGKQTIRVRFTVDVTGNVTDILARSPHPELAIEAKRVISEVPQMKPGKQSNKEVAVIYDLPIIFQVQY